ncbi:tyrosine-type recombinase/integrase [Hyphobacterium sp.]|uniref:tyrosine-type recombinase/integrase n=1 Tax=Hyphobacterium sp. TaxID=2004662 RepID=UPI003BA95965
MSLKISYLHSRAGRLYFRRRIPDELHALAGQREWKLSLGLNVGQEREASNRVLELVAQTDAALDRLVSGIPTTLTLRRTAQANAHSLMTFTEAFELYVRHKPEGELGKAEETAFQQFLECIGDRPLAEIDRLSVRQWMAWLETERGQSAATIRRRLTSAKAVFNFALDTLDLPYRNPFARQKVKQQAPLRRLPFHTSHLALIDKWVARVRPDNATGLILRLLKGTGCRPLEIGGLQAADVDLNSETPLIRIRPNPRRRLKTNSSERIIPIVGDTRDAAKLALEASSGDWLFPAKCAQTELLSARLNKAIRASGVPHSPALTAYSFRHTFVEAMRRASIRPEIVRLIIGHQRLSITEKYGANFYELSELAEAVEMSTPELGRVSESNF